MYRIKLNYKTKGWNIQKRVFFIWINVYKDKFYNYEDGIRKLQELRSK